MYLFICFFHNRSETHINARKSYGGVAAIFKLDVYNEYDIDVVDKSVDGLMILRFTHKLTDYAFLLACCYLPPEQSVWGRDAVHFFSHILSHLYNYCDDDAFYLCGDLNSKLGKMSDFIPEVDKIEPRICIDNSTNKHGSVFQDFLLDAKCCVINGRVCPANDNYTFVSTRGKSVVDYFVSAIDCLHTCKAFSVFTPRELLSRYGNVQAADVPVDGHIPDHSLLLLEVTTCQYSNGDARSTHDKSATRGIHSSPYFNDNHVFYKRFKIDSVPDDFCGSEMSKLAILSLIDRLEADMDSQHQIDAIYSDICSLYHTELNKFFRSNNISPLARKRLYRSSKPFWNDELQTKWKKLCAAERKFLKSEGNIRKLAREEFTSIQKDFDRSYRKAERKFKLENLNEIEENVTKNPKVFWEMIKNLGPRKKGNIHMEIYEEGGVVNNDVPTVLHKWKTEYENLYNLVDSEDVYDDEFLNQCKSFVDNAGDTDENSNNISDDINNLEVQTALIKAKIRKAIGIDNLPNEILKNPNTVDLLVVLFRRIYDLGFIPSIWRISILTLYPKIQWLILGYLCSTEA